MTDTDSDSYPSAWTPKGLPSGDLPPTAVELFLESLSDNEFIELCNKVRPRRPT